MRLAEVRKNKALVSKITGVLNKKIEKLENKIDTNLDLSKKVAKHNKRLEEHDGRFDNHDDRIKALENSTSASNLLGFAVVVVGACLVIFDPETPFSRSHEQLSGLVAVLGGAYLMHKAHSNTSTNNHSSSRKEERQQSPSQVPGTTFNQAPTSKKTTSSPVPSATTENSTSALASS